MVVKKRSRAVAHIPGANIKEFLGTILSELKPQQIPRLSKDGEFSERKTLDQKFFSVSGMGFGQQPLGGEEPLFRRFLVTSRASKRRDNRVHQ
jgi:hypothetical protein